MLTAVPAATTGNTNATRLQALGSTSQVRALENQSPESIFTSRPPVPPGKGEATPTKVCISRVQGQEQRAKGQKAGPCVRTATE